MGKKNKPGVFGRSASRNQDNISLLCTIPKRPLHFSNDGAMSLHPSLIFYFILVIKGGFGDDFRVYEIELSIVRKMPLDWGFSESI